MGNDRENEIIPYNMEAENTNKETWPKKHQNGWRIQNNNESQVMYRKPNNITIIKVSTLEWAGHLVRMSADRTVKRKYFLGNQTEEEKQKTKIKVVRLH
jgi:hypothetical protein